MYTGKRPTRPDRMQPDEFEVLCKSLYGTYWRHAASRALRRDAKMMARYASGESVVPEEVAQRLRQIAGISPAAKLVKGVLLELLATVGGPIPVAAKRSAIHERAHGAALEIINLLSRAGHLKGLEE